MRITSKEFWDAVLHKLIETAISVKIWIMGMIVYFVTRLYMVADDLRKFMILNISIETQKIQILSNLQGKIYDIATALILSGVVVVVLSRVSFQHTRLKYNNDEDEEEQIKNNFS